MRLLMLWTLTVAVYSLAVSAGTALPASAGAVRLATTALAFSS
jgi:hypothetical protein